MHLHIWQHQMYMKLYKVSCYQISVKQHKYIIKRIVQYTLD
uniref:Uncharacterized protein n=1 Tax=Ciona intestinalis TaxID=7719 RepID=H2XLP8_CIOIN